MGVMGVGDLLPDGVVEDYGLLGGITSGGFPEIYHPSEEKQEYCAAGRLLLLTPWNYHYRKAEEAITVAECKTMNCIAQAVCRLRDDWWK